jgi:hypothetical protein
MRGDEHRNKAPKSTYGRAQNNELHHAMHTGTVPRKLSRRMKKLKQFIQINIFYTNVYKISYKFQTCCCETWYCTFYKQVSLNVMLQKEGNFGQNKRLLILQSVRTLLVQCS